jgi:ATP-dependent helicase HepA
LASAHEKMARLLHAAAGELCKYLENVLPALHGADWWKAGVLDKLSYSQQRIVDDNGIRSLHDLDLAAALRVLDRNWDNLAGPDGLTFETRNYLKEMSSVRNRWAHASASGYGVEVIYRDMDTLQRFLEAFGASEKLIEETRKAKITLMAQAMRSAPPATSPPTPPPAPPAATPPPAPLPAAPATEFTVGHMVCLRSNPTSRGPVMAVQPGRPENRYVVFLDNQQRTLYASQLQADVAPKPAYEQLSVSDFHAYLSALQIRHPSLSALYSLNAARIDFIPYQFRPVLKFIRSDRPRLLIADSVGVGKTIEAGLILRELQARRDIRSVLIICPRPLVTERKWEVEMKRFDERFTHLDGDTLRYCIDEMDLDGAWPELHQKTILPYSLFNEAMLLGSSEGRRRKAQRGLLQLDPPPRFDLVIVDEAHHIRNTDTYGHQGVRFFCENAEAAIFMTATPIQLGSNDLFVLLNLLRPDLVIDKESFKQMAEPNPHLNHALDAVRGAQPGWMDAAQRALEDAAETPWGEAILHRDPAFQEAHTALAQPQMAAEDRVSLITTLEGLHTFNGMINRTRRRDIGNFTIRKPETVEVGFTASQRQLHDELLCAQARIFSRLHGDRNIMFMLTTLRRQAASCLYGLAPFIDGILTRHLDRLTWVEINDQQEAPDLESFGSIEDDILRVMQLAEQLDATDPKLEALKRIVRNKQHTSNRRVMVFSSFRHTLSYLYDRLREEGFRVGMVHGGTPDDERVALRNRFKLEREDATALDVLLFSEVGCEGLDYQFCDCLVNYDLPWNPMRIEQRIGRIDRNGQKSESVAIYNLITPGTVDADIYDRCLIRIGVFNHELGANEEILGEIGREIENIAQDFSLTEAERQAKFQQLADNQIRLLQEQARLEEQQAELFGIRLPADCIKQEIEESSSFWLEPTALQNLVETYLHTVTEKDQGFVLGERSLKTLRLSQEVRQHLLNDLRGLSRQTTPVYREWEQWLKGGNPLLLITFDQEIAGDHPEAAFITPVHPLVRQAAQSLDLRKRMATAIQVQDDELPTGTYPFALYQWQFRGMRDDLAIRAVAQSSDVAERLTNLLAQGKSVDLDPNSWLDDATVAALEDAHYLLWSEAKAEHEEWTRRRAQYQQQSLATSHRARMALLTDQLGQATNQNIQRMRTAQIANAQADFDLRSRELEQSILEADVLPDLIALGIVHIVRKPAGEAAVEKTVKGSPDAL